MKSLAKNRMGGEFVPEAGQVAERFMARIPEGASVPWADPVHLPDRVVAACALPGK